MKSDSAFILLSLIFDTAILFFLVLNNLLNLLKHSLLNFLSENWVWMSLLKIIDFHIEI